MKWFKHDANANMDSKLKRVRLKYGMEGYGLYWFCLELIAATVEIHNLKFNLEYDAELIGNETGISPERVQEMMNNFVTWGLFENQEGIITCLKMSTRTDEYTKQLIRSREKLHSNYGETTEKITRDSLESTEKLGVIRRERRERNIYGENNISPNIKNESHVKNKKFTIPTIEEITEYCESRKNNIDPEQFYDFYTTKDWMVGKTRMKDWKAAIRTWERSSNQQTFKSNVDNLVLL